MPGHGRAILLLLNMMVMLREVLYMQNIGGGAGAVLLVWTECPYLTLGQVCVLALGVLFLVTLFSRGRNFSQYL